MTGDLLVVESKPELPHRPTIGSDSIAKELSVESVSLARPGAATVDPYTSSGMFQRMRAARLIRDARKRSGLSQAALAKYARTSQPAIARYEAGKATPSLATLERILRACKTSIVVGWPTPAAAPRRRGRLALIRRSRDRILSAARRHGVRDVQVFGAVARGEDDPSSDVDLLVDLDPDRTLLDLIGFKQEAEEILGLPVDAVAPRSLKAAVRDNAVREARAI